MISPLISITIPAYKNIDFLRKLLNSIRYQTYKNFEVIITDDSPNDDLLTLVDEFKECFILVYKKNFPAAGSPQNWNEGIYVAKGDWIKIMHDDDWFATNTALQVYVDYILANPNVTFFYAAYCNVNENGKTEKKENTFFDIWLLKKSILNIFKEQKIGNPSCIIYKKDACLNFEPTLKWVVDFEYYLRYITKHKTAKYISKLLICVGINDEQITNDCQKNITVEIPENLYMLDNFGVNMLRNVFVYDYYWRLLRRFNINDIHQIKPYYHIKSEENASVLKKMAKAQSKFSIKILQIGFISKIVMAINFTKFYFSPTYRPSQNP